jgi:surface polysaccharide O-acyltransferase-like enzyme
MKDNKRIMTRQSNLELLRIVAMFMILLAHLFGHGINFAKNISPISYNLNANIIYFLSIHVNLFLLITGYFGIKFKWTGIISLFVKCSFYSVSIYLISCYIHNDFTYVEFAKRFLFFFRESPWWFVEIYFYLFMMAPILNKAIESLTKVQFQKTLILLFFLNCIVGGLFLGKINVTGFSLSQFVFMYFIGGYIRRYFNVEEFLGKVKKIRFKLFLSYLLLMLVNIGMKAILGDSFWRGYVNPFYILGAISIFLLFLTFNFKSKAVNWIAASSFSVYLLHDEDTFMRKLYVIACDWVYTSLPQPYLYIPVVIIGAILLFFICIFIDKIVNYITNPLLILLKKMDPVQIINAQFKKYEHK